MKLDRIHIKNYRSIMDVVINLDPACRVLVGKNGAGKSNILNALSLLNDDTTPLKKTISLVYTCFNRQFSIVIFLGTDNAVL